MKSFISPQLCYCMPLCTPYFPAPTTNNASPLHPQQRPKRAALIETPIIHALRLSIRPLKVTLAGPPPTVAPYHKAEETTALA
jgi:hypothetical protein